MNLENSFIVPSVIALRDAMKRLAASLESRPKLPAAASEQQQLLLLRFHDLQTRLGGVIDAYEMDIEAMLRDL